MTEIVYMTHDYDREILEPIFLRGLQFSHISDADIAAAFDDVAEGRVEDFDYQTPLSRYEGNKQWTRLWTRQCAFRKASFDARTFHRYGREIEFFNPVEMGVLLAHRHGTICWVCCSSNARHFEPAPMFNAISFGRNGQQDGLFANYCSECSTLSRFTDEAFIAVIAKEMRRRKPSSFIQRLRSAPQLRVQPQRARAA